MNNQNQNFKERGEIFEQTQDYVRVSKAITLLESQVKEGTSLSLSQLASALGLSEAYTQRLFKRWAGISPKQFALALQFAKARKFLTDKHSVLAASYEAGLSGPGRLHDLCVTIEAMSPGEIKKGGEGITLHYGIHDSPFGLAVLFATERGLAGLGFADPGAEQDVISDYQRRWPKATLLRDEEMTHPYRDKIFGAGGGDLSLFLKGTPFQIQVWQALLRIPYGSVASYGQIAIAIDRPKAVRAVGSAIGQNPLAYLIPCHRVLRESGAMGGYHWGLERKQAILAYEQAQNV